MARGIRAGMRLIGVPAAIRKLKLVGSVAGRDLGLIVLRSAYSIRDEAREIVHSRTNPWGGASEPYQYTDNLKNGIQVERGGRAGLGVYTQMVSASSRAGGADREYASFEEEGTSKAPAHPYLAPAAKRQYPRTLTMVKALGLKIERL